MTSQSLQELGALVRAARKAAGWRQQDLANAARVHRFTLIKLELGQLADINHKTLVSILEPLGLELRAEPKRLTGLPVLGERP